MRNIKILSALGLVAIVLVAVLSQSPQSTNVGKTWQHPIDVTLEHQPFVHYGKMVTTGAATYFRLPVSGSTTLPIQVDIPSTASSKYAPQIAIFEPYERMIGPILPIEQPPKTIAMVYPMTPAKPMFDLSTQTSYTVRLEAEPNLTESGTYIVAAYNAGSIGGSYRLHLGEARSKMEWSDAWTMPMMWWHNQTFAGISWWTCIVPLLLGLLAWSIYLRLDHHKLHAHKSYSATVTPPIRSATMTKATTIRNQKPIKKGITKKKV